MEKRKVSIICFTPNGNKLAERISAVFSEEWESEIFYKSGSTAEYLKTVFVSGRVIIFISSAGIAVRLISPLLKKKDTDPAVIVMDELGKYVIPILSGHIGGANEFAETVAQTLGSEAVITTATDIGGHFAADVWAVKHNCAIGDIGQIKEISSRILSGEKVGFISDFPFTGELPEGVVSGTECRAGICVSTDDTKRPFEHTLNVIPKITVIGAGCRRGTDSELFEETLLSTLRENKISIKSVSALATIDIKSGEKCMLDFCAKYGLQFKISTAEELNKVEGEFTSSEFVKRVTGTDNVCERSAALHGGKIILKKSSGRGITVALAEKEWECKF